MHTPLPIDILTAFMVEADPRIGGAFNFGSFLAGGFVTLVLLNSPEVLLGGFASAGNDIRELRSVRMNVTMGSYGGGLHEDCYYTSGQMLLSHPNPVIAYREIGYTVGRVEGGYYWVVPRKPTIWYARFGENHTRRNDEEVRVRIERNPVAVLTKCARPDVGECDVSEKESFGYRMSMHICRNSTFGFVFKGVREEEESGFFQLGKGYTWVRYTSMNGDRVVEGGEVQAVEGVSFPRFETFWRDMAQCFLNSISFNRPVANLPTPDRLAISALVRTAGVASATGFEKRALRIEGSVREVRLSNVSKWVVVIMCVCVCVRVGSVVFFRFQLKVLTRELEQIIVVGGGLAKGGVLSGVPRYAREEKGLFESVWVKVRRNLGGEEKTYAELVLAEEGEAV